MKKNNLEVEHFLAAGSNYFLLAVGVFFGSASEIAIYAIITFLHLALKGIVRQVISNYLLQKGTEDKIKRNSSILCFGATLVFLIIFPSIPGLSFKLNLFSAFFIFFAVFLSFFGEVTRLVMVSQRQINSSLKIQVAQTAFLILAFLFMIGTKSYAENLVLLIFFLSFIVSGMFFVRVMFSVSKVEKLKNEENLFWTGSLISSLLLSVLSFIPPIFITYLFFDHMQSETIQIYQSSNFWFIPLSFLINIHYLEAVSNSKDSAIKINSNRNFFRWAFFLLLVASVYGVTRDLKSFYISGAFLICLTSISTFLRQKMNIELIKSFELFKILIVQFVYVLTVLGLSNVFLNSSFLLSIHILFLLAEIVSLCLTKVFYKKAITKND
jgi:hypothetical protein